MKWLDADGGFSARVHSPLLGHASLLVHGRRDMEGWSVSVHHRSITRLIRHQLLFAQNLFLGPTQFLLKVAILTLYFQLFSVYRTMRIMIWAGIIFCGLIYLPHPILVIIFNAPHGSATWADLATNGMPQKLAFYAPIHGIGSIVIDIYIFIIPLLMFRNLQISSRKRMQLIAIFLTGLLCVSSLISLCPHIIVHRD